MLLLCKNLSKIVYLATKEEPFPASAGIYECMKTVQTETLIALGKPSLQFTAGRPKLRNFLSTHIDKKHQHPQNNKNLHVEGSVDQRKFSLKGKTILVFIC